MRVYKVKNEAGDEFEVDEVKLSEAEKDGFLPVVTNGREEHRVAFKDFELAVKDGFKPKTGSDMGGFESFARGGADSVTFGFDDELYGGAAAIGSAAKEFFTGEDDGKSFYENYQSGRDEVRSLKDEAWEANPMAYGAGQIGGALVTAPLAAGKIAQVAGKGAGLGKLLKAGAVGAVEGGLYGAGASTAEVADGEIGQLATDTAMGAGFGAAGGAIGEGLGRVASGTAKALKKATPTKSVVKKAGNLAFDLPEEYTEKLLKNPKKEMNDVSLLGIQEDLGDAFNALEQEIKTASDKAWDTLRSDKLYLSDDLRVRVVNVLKDNGVIKDAADGSFAVSSFGQDKLAHRKAGEIMEDLANLDKMSEKDLKNLIVKIDGEINYDKQELDTANKVLNQIRGEIDSVLKSVNKDYERAIVPVNYMMGLRKDVIDHYNFKRKTGSGYGPSDTTTNKLNSVAKSLNKETKGQAKSTLKRMSRYRKPTDVGDILAEQKGVKFQPESFVEDLDNFRILDTTKGGVKNGTRSAFTGAVGGLGLDMMMGGFGPLSMVGLATGYAKDQYGRRVGRNVMRGLAPGIKGFDAFIQGKASWVDNLDPKFRQVLKSAARRGTDAVAITHFLLGQQDPEYQAAVKAAQEE